MRKRLSLLAAAAASLFAFASAAGAHVVQPGESLWSVAQANGISAAQLAAANGLGADSQLIAGTTIAVPYATSAATATTQTASVGGRVVQAGESLWSIAQANGVSVSALAAANGLSPTGML